MLILIFVYLKLKKKNLHPNIPALLCNSSVASMAPV